MMTPKAIERAQRLLGDHRRIATVQWNGVVDHSGFRPSKDVFGQARSPHTSSPEAADEELQWAIEEFRKCKLAAIDAELRELGLGPEAGGEEESPDE